MFYLEVLGLSTKLVKDQFIFDFVNFKKLLNPHFYFVLR